MNPLIHFIFFGCNTKNPRVRVHCSLLLARAAELLTQPQAHTARAARLMTSRADKALPIHSLICPATPLIA